VKETDIMMNYNTRLPGLNSARGTHYDELSGRFYYATGGGEVYLLPTSPASVVLQKSESINKGGLKNLNGLGVSDLSWATTNELRAINGARLLLLSGFNSLDEIAVSALQEANWNASVTALPEDGSNTTGRFYAFRIPQDGDYHYAKVRIYKSGTQTRIDWVTYNVSPNARRVGAGYEADMRDIIVSEYETVMYFTASYAGGGGGRVFRTVRVPHPTNDPQFASYADEIHAEPLNDPQQMALDGGFVYVVDSTSLWRIDIGFGEQVEVVKGLAGGTGLLLNVESGALKAYISTAAGDLFIVDISDFDGANPIPLPAKSRDLGGASGFMSWADRERTAIYVALRNTRQVLRIDPQNSSLVPNIEGETPVSEQVPWSVEILGDNKLYVACETEIGEFSRSIAASDNLLLGIGLIPFDYINNSAANPAEPAADDGKADTSSAPGYYFSGHPNLPFGGVLTLQLNHQKAWNSGIRYYSVKLKNLLSGKSRDITSSFVDFQWKETETPPRFKDETTSPSGGLYPVREPEHLWYNPYMAAKISTDFSDNGHNVLTVEFFGESKQPVSNGTFHRLICIDNTRCRGALELPRLGTAVTPPAAGDYPSLICGCLAYETKNDLLEIDFKAWQPQGSGTYSLSLSRGVPGLAQSGSVTSTPELMTKQTLAPGKPIRVGHIMGDCDVANVVIYLSVPSRVIDGFGWVHLGVNTHKSFTLIKGPLTHTPWTSPE
jgi:hypothetical protein